VKKTKNPLILVFAIIGVCAVLYGVWHLYAQQVAQERARALFAAPASSGVPDIFHDAPPPPQP
jgi:hypothetical protein